MTWLVPVIAAVLGGGGLVAVVNAVAGRRGSKADAAGKLSEGALRWVEQFQETAAAAEIAAVAARADTAAARVELATYRAEAAELRAELAATREETRRVVAGFRADVRRVGLDYAALRRAVHDPGATIDQIRVLILNMAPEPPTTRE